MKTLLSSLGKTFEELAELSAQDPAGFEAWRTEMLEAELSYPQDGERERRLRGLQFRIDMTRRQTKTPLGACVKLSGMMWDSELALAHAFFDIESYEQSLAAAEQEAVVIEFPHK